MGLIFWGCCRKLSEHFLLVREGTRRSQKRMRISGSCGDVCPLGTHVVGPAQSRENRISSFANEPIIAAAPPHAFALFFGDGPGYCGVTQEKGLLGKREPGRLGGMVLGLVMLG